jgi:hypothetical protein
MTPPLALVTTDAPIFRVARAPDPWAWPPWPYADDDGTFGGRFDDPRGEYRVLYASSQREGAFAETLARYRRDLHVEAELRLIAGDGEDERYPELVDAAVVPKEWLESRLLGTATHHGAFVDLGHGDSFAHLRAALADRVLHYGLDDLDAGAIRRAPRGFTQEISRYVFARARTDSGDAVSGIRYGSRLGDEFVNWAIFEPSPPADVRSDKIDANDDALVSIFTRFELTWG